VSLSIIQFASNAVIDRSATQQFLHDEIDTTNKNKSNIHIGRANPQKAWRHFAQVLLVFY
jgi:hypothetical protein